VDQALVHHYPKAGIGRRDDFAQRYP
jgi:hypothetical protein